ncbi:MAG: AraC family transcriptional regulator [Pikeienuella sp.]
MVHGAAIDYPSGTLIPFHSHERDQLLHTLSGVALMTTAGGRWIVPPEYALWLPAGCAHQGEMLGAVRMRSVYIRAGTVDMARDAPLVLGMSALMRALMIETIESAGKGESEPANRRDALLTDLLIEEIPRLAQQPLAIPLPVDRRLTRLCRAFLAAPSARAPLDDWAAAAGMSRRSLSRHFREETGLTLDQWRQQACVFAALPRLIAGEQVTTLALDLGYESPAAFTTMFRRLLGRSPRAYARGVAGARPPRGQSEGAA